MGNAPQVVTRLDSASSSSASLTSSSNNAHRRDDSRESSQNCDDASSRAVEPTRLCLLLLKNPWSDSTVWKGDFGDRDDANWLGLSDATTGKTLQDTLFGKGVVDPRRSTGTSLEPISREEAAARGMFWICYDDLTRCFSSLYVNWNNSSELFPFVSRYHHTLNASIGPKNDEKNLGSNPQFELETNVSKSEKGLVWLVLSRHVTTSIQRSEEDEDFIALHVFDRRSGKRVFYPRNALVHGSYSNNPHVLIQFSPPSGSGHRYTVVVSVYHRTRSIDYTLSVYSTDDFKLRPIPLNLGNEFFFKSAWDAHSAGGSRNNASFMDNPQYRVVVPMLVGRGGDEKTKVALRVRLLGPAGRPLNVRVVRKVYSSPRIEHFDTDVDEVATSGEYRKGFVFAECQVAADGATYHVVPSTFEKGAMCSFHLYVESSHPLREFGPAPREGDGMIEYVSGGGGGGERTPVRFQRFVVSPLSSSSSSVAPRALVRTRVVYDDPDVSALLGDARIDVTVRAADGRALMEAHDDDSPCGVGYEFPLDAGRAEVDVGVEGEDSCGVESYVYSTVPVRIEKM